MQDNMILCISCLVAFLDFLRYMVIQDNDDLTNINFDKVAAVNDFVTIQNNRQLASLSLPALATVGSVLTLSNNGQLSSISFPGIIIFHVKVFPASV